MTFYLPYAQQRPPLRRRLAARRIGVHRIDYAANAIAVANRLADCRKRRISDSPIRFA
jgi:hypothetical protein